MTDSPKNATVRQRRGEAGVDISAEKSLDVPTPTKSVIKAAQEKEAQASKAVNKKTKASKAAKPSAKPVTPASSATVEETPTATAGPAPNFLFFVYASLAGVFGALSSVVGKTAVAADAVPQLVAFVTDATGLAPPPPESPLFTLLPLALRVLFFAANAVFTGQMWRYYIKSLSLGPTPVCQIINTGTNFAVSALCGIVFFSEEVSTMWAVGATLVVLGLALVVTDPTVASS